MTTTGPPADPPRADLTATATIIAARRAGTIIAARLATKPIAPIIVMANALRRDMTTIATLIVTHIIAAHRDGTTIVGLRTPRPIATIVTMAIISCRGGMIIAIPRATLLLAMTDTVIIVTARLIAARASRPEATATMGIARRLPRAGPTAMTTREPATAAAAKTTPRLIGVRASEVIVNLAATLDLSSA